MIASSQWIPANFPLVHNLCVHFTTRVQKHALKSLPRAWASSHRRWWWKTIYCLNLAPKIRKLRAIVVCVLQFSFLIEFFSLACRTIFFWWPNDDSSSFLNLFSGLSKKKEIIDYCLSQSPLLLLFHYCPLFIILCGVCAAERRGEQSTFFENYHTKLIIYLSARTHRGAAHTHKNIIL